VGHRRGLLEILHHIAAAVGGGQVGAPLEVVVGHVDLVAGQDIAQEDHALAGIGGVGALGEAGQQLGEGGEGFPRRAGVAAGVVGGQEVAEKAPALGQGRQALDVVGVVDVGVAGVEADEAVGGGDGGFVVGGAVVGVHQFEL